MNSSSGGGSSNQAVGQSVNIGFGPNNGGGKCFNAIIQNFMNEEDPTKTKSFKNSTETVVPSAISNPQNFQKPKQHMFALKQKISASALVGPHEAPFSGSSTPMNHHNHFLAT